VRGDRGLELAGRLVSAALGHGLKPA
jgi:hypothetical protein